MVETTDLGLGHDPPLARQFNLARPGSIASEGLVGPRVVIVGEVLTGFRSRNPARTARFSTRRRVERQPVEFYRMLYGMPR